MVRVTHFAEGADGSLHEVVRIGRAFRLSEDVGDTYRFEDGTHSATGLDTGTVGGGTEKDARATEFELLLVRNSAFVHGHLHEVLLGGFYALGDSGSDFVGLTETPTDDTVFVTYHDDGCKRESATTFCNLCGTIDSYKAILELNVVG